MKPEWKKILQLRSVKDKVAICIDCDLADPTYLPLIAELVREDIMTFMERTVLMQLAVIDRKTGNPHLTRSGFVRRPNVDVYKLTEKGIALCDAEGIKQL